MAIAGQITERLGRVAKLVVDETVFVKRGVIENSPLANKFYAMSRLLAKQALEQGEEQFLTAQ